jgi:SAM-dependent methyltransferase
MPITSHEILPRIESFPVWHYRFDLAGHITPVRSPRLANRHEQRRKYFFEPLVRLCGGSFEGKRVLDIGCNAGFWSLQAIENGADFVLGVDARQMHVDQANFVFEVKGIPRDRYEFALADIFEFDFSRYGSFDIVLCLGLLYHVSKQVALFETISALKNDILVIDTALSPLPGSYLRVNFENIDNPLNAAYRNLVMVPTKDAVTDLARAFGYEVAVLRPKFDDWTGARRYRHGRRKAFLCARKTPLAGLTVPTEGRGPSLREFGWMLADLTPQIPKRLRRRPRS